MFKNLRYGYQTTKNAVWIFTTLQFLVYCPDFSKNSPFSRWTNTDESIRSGMAVLDVAVPTGYMIQQQKLDSYILSKRVRNLQRARYQERKVLFYFDYVSIFLIPDSGSEG